MVELRSHAEATLPRHVPLVGTTSGAPHQPPRRRRVATDISGLCLHPLVPVGSGHGDLTPTLCLQHRVVMTLPGISYWAFSIQSRHTSTLTRALLLVPWCFSLPPMPSSAHRPAFPKTPTYLLVSLVTSWLPTWLTSIHLTRLVSTFHLPSTSQLVHWFNCSTVHWFYWSTVPTFHSSTGHTDSWSSFCTRSDNLTLSDWQDLLSNIRLTHTPYAILVSRGPWLPQNWFKKKKRNQLGFYARGIQNSRLYYPERGPLPAPPALPCAARGWPPASPGYVFTL